MKNFSVLLCAAVMLLALVGCGGQFDEAALDVAGIEVVSASINAEGRLLTVCAADKKNDPSWGEPKPPVELERG